MFVCLYCSIELMFRVETLYCQCCLFMNVCSWFYCIISYNLSYHFQLNYTYPDMTRIFTIYHITLNPRHSILFVSNLSYFHSIDWTEHSIELYLNWTFFRQTLLSIWDIVFHRTIFIHFGTILSIMYSEHLSICPCLNYS